MSRQPGFAGRRMEALDLVLQKGVFAGVAAGAVMGFFAMLASATYEGRGFFTPAYNVAFTIDPNTMAMSLQRAGAGDRFWFSREAFLFGVAVHVIVSGVLGMLFALAAMRLHLRGTRALWGGLAYGLAVLAVMSLVVLPLAASLFDAGAPISRMGREMGWVTFAVLHAIYGLALGAWIYVRPQDLPG